MSGKLPIIAGMATIPGREKACKEAVESLLPQVDFLCIYGNGPFRPNFLNGINKSFFTPNLFDRGDSGKFYFHLVDDWVSKGDRYISFHKDNNEPYIYLSVDDDLIYPPNYVQTLVDAITQNPKAIYSHHGRVIPGRVKSYYRIGAKYPCLHDVRAKVAVNCVGTGVCGFRSDLVNITQEDFPLQFKNMADIHLAVYAQKNEIPMYVLPHKKGWIKHSPHVDTKQTIWYKHHKNDSKQTIRVNSWGNWRVFD